MNPELSLSNVPDDQPVKCIYCHREFQNPQALIGHLRFCSMRIRLKHIEVPYRGGTYRFEISGNMSRRTMQSIYALERTGNAVLCLGGLHALKAGNYIKDYKHKEIPAKNTVEGGNSSLEGSSSLKGSSFSGGETK